MKKIEYILLAFLCIMGFTACQDDLGIEGKGGVDLTRMCQVELTFGVPQSENVVVSRADSDPNSYSGIMDMKVFVFDGDKFLQCSDVTNLQDVAGSTSGGRAYRGTVTLYAGNQTVYAVANGGVTGYWEKTPEEPLSALEEAARSNGKKGFLKVLYTLASATINNGTLPVFVGGYMPLSGSGEVSVTPNGSGASVYGTVSLQRMVARIDFKINTVSTHSQNGNSIVFKPESYQVYRIPKTGYPIADNANAGSTDNAQYYDMENIEQIDPAEADNIAYITDKIYLPENLQTKNVKNQGCTKYEDRERKTDENTAWKYAPDNATYVVIKGVYRETEKNSDRLVKYADVAYTIHLGDFSDNNYSNFDVLRNNRYTYTITVVGVDRIIAEAEREDETNKDYQNGAEGNVIGLDKYSKMFRLDAHYEQVYVKYGLSDFVDVVKEAVADNPHNDEKIKEAVANNFILAIHTPMNTRPASDELIRPYLTDSENEAMEGIDYHWVEFLPLGESTEWNDMNDGIAAYPKDKTRLLSPWKICNEMGKAVYDMYKRGDGYQIPNDNPLDIYQDGGKYYVRFTIFVDEYFYLKDLNGQKVTWREFTNKEDRTMLISSDTKVSSDHNSTYSTALTYITQHSIYTFYHTNSADDTNALGIETYCENCDRDNSGQIGLKGFGTPEGDNKVNNQSNGRANMKDDVLSGSTTDWNTYIDFTNVGYKDDNSEAGNEQHWFDYHQGGGAYYACLSRNRDLNGNGEIDEDEIRWYLPALSQYLRMGIATQALPAETRLYTGTKSEMTGTYPQDYVKDGALYYTNSPISSDKDFTLYWAVEVGAYGTEGKADSKGAKIRCVRNLPKGELVRAESNEAILVGDDALAEPVYGKLKQLPGKDNYVFDFGHRLIESLFRNSSEPMSGGYEPHHEMGTAMKLPQAFVVSKKYIQDRWGNMTFNARYGFGITQRGDTWQWGDDPCDDYYESWEDRGKWRTPNLNELMVMTTVAGKLGLSSRDGTLCRTQFSNTAVRSGFRYNGSFITATGAREYNNRMVRCVRDATEAERNSATEVQ